MKKKILIAVLVIILILVALFFLLLYLLAQGIGGAVQAAGNEFFNNMAEGIAGGLIDNGIEIAGDMVSEGVSTILGGLK